MNAKPAPSEPVAAGGLSVARRAAAGRLGLRAPGGAPRRERVGAGVPKLAKLASFEMQFLHICGGLVLGCIKSDF